MECSNQLTNMMVNMIIKMAINQSWINFWAIRLFAHDSYVNFLESRGTERSRAHFWFRFMTICFPSQMAIHAGTMVQDRVSKTCSTLYFPVRKTIYLLHVFVFLYVAEHFENKLNNMIFLGWIRDALGGVGWILHEFWKMKFEKEKIDHNTVKIHWAYV